MIGLLYFLVIILANTLGAISGMGGGVIIKPVLDAIGAHSVGMISFYSTVAVLTMSIVSTLRQLKTGAKINWLRALQISLGALVGGSLGNTCFETLLKNFDQAANVQLVQIGLTMLTLFFALGYSRSGGYSWHLEWAGWYVLVGLLLGFLASLLGIGGGPINVAALMLCFGMPIKEATVYSIITIFFSQLAKVSTIALTTGFGRYDLSVLPYVLSAAVLGGFLGAYCSQLLSAKKVTLVYQSVMVGVILLNILNGIQILFHR